MNRFDAIKKANRVVGLSIGIVGVLIIARMISPEFLAGHSDWNAPFAYTATGLFVIMFLPGVVSRFGIGGMIQLIANQILIYRRTIGLLMYVAALAHFLFLVDQLPWFSDGLVRWVDALTATGAVAMIVLLPVLLSSNNGSIKYFKKHWKTLQRMTYLALPLIGMHLLYSDHYFLGGIYMVTSVLVIVSHFMNQHRKNSSVLSTLGATLGVIVLGFVLTYTTVRYADQSQAAVRSGDNENELDALREKKLDIEKQLQENEAQLKLQEGELEEYREVKAAEEDELIKEEATRIEAERIAALQDYRDGTFSANGVYVTDHGKVTESIDVTLTIQNDIVQAVSVKGNLTKNKSVRYHDRFVGEISSVVVGKSIDSLNVQGVGGASDTSDGFRSALSRIKAQASTG